MLVCTCITGRITQVATCRYICGEAGYPYFLDSTFSVSLTQVLIGRFGCLFSYDSSKNHAQEKKRKELPEALNPPSRTPYLRCAAVLYSFWRQCQLKYLFTPVSANKNHPRTSVSANQNPSKGDLKTRIKEANRPICGTYLCHNRNQPNCLFPSTPLSSISFLFVQILHPEPGYRVRPRNTLTVQHSFITSEQPQH